MDHLNIKNSLILREHWGVDIFVTLHHNIYIVVIVVVIAIITIIITNIIIISGSPEHQQQSHPCENTGALPTLGLLEFRDAFPPPVIVIVHAIITTIIMSSKRCDP